jgi:hypothetical protein
MSGRKSAKRVKTTHIHVCPTDMEPVSSNTFRDFLLSRAFDIISEGRYRKHFILGKEVGDTWAISMQTSIAMVLARVKNVTMCIKNTENFTCKNLRMICSEVTSSQLPPSASCTEVGTCVITKVKSRKSRKTLLLICTAKTVPTTEQIGRLYQSRR